MFSAAIKKSVPMLRNHPLWSMQSPDVDRALFRILIPPKLVLMALRSNLNDIFIFFVDEASFDVSQCAEDLILIAMMKKNIRAIQLLLDNGVLNHLSVDNDNPNLSEDMIEVLKQLGNMKVRDFVNEID